MYDNPYCSALLNLLVPLHISGVSHNRFACYYHPNVVLHASPFPKYQPSKITLTIKLKLEIRCTEASRKNKWRINKKERLRATPSDVLLFNIYSLTISVLYRDSKYKLIICSHILSHWISIVLFFYRSYKNCVYQFSQIQNYYGFSKNIRK